MGLEHGLALAPGVFLNLLLGGIILKIVVGSTNKAKVQAVLQAIPTSWELITSNVPSGVSNQPFSDEETIQGAMNRASNALHQTDAHLAIGLEGGVVETPYGLFLCNWAALKVRETQKTYIAGGARILIPEEVANKLREGKELGPVMEEYTTIHDVRNNEGAIGIFTNSKVTRSQMFKHIMDLLIGQFEYEHLNN